MPLAIHVLNLLRLLPRCSNQTRTLCIETKEEATLFLRKNEYSNNLGCDTSIASYECNQLASNDPIEDTRAEAKIPLLNSYLFGVFDGHGGTQCAQATSQLIFHYIAAALMPFADIDTYYQNYHKDTITKSLIENLSEPTLLLETETRQLHEESYLTYLRDLLSKRRNSCSHQPTVAEMLEEAIVRFDNDICQEPLRTNLSDSTKNKALLTAMSGCVCSIAYINNCDLFVANVGDVSAVLGVLNDRSGRWKAHTLSREHHSSNPLEKQRILSEHPNVEKSTVIRNNRLLGNLAPLRALGDCCFKWNKDLITNHIVPKFGEVCVPQYYLTPPYLIATPEIFHYKLTERDKFLIIASDGLWELLEPEDVVVTVADYLMKRESYIDKNVATHLIRKALIERYCFDLRLTEDENIIMSLNMPKDRPIRVISSSTFHNNISDLVKSMNNIRKNTYRIIRFQLTDNLTLLWPYSETVP